MNVGFCFNGYSLPIVRQIPVKNKKSFALFWQGGVSGLLILIKTKNSDGTIII